jgi:hypothetical protein
MSKSKKISVVKAQQNKLLAWWHEQSPKVKAISVAVIVIAIAGLYLAVSAISERIATEQQKLIDDTFISFGYEDKWADVCSGKDMLYKDENSEEQSIYKGSTDTTKFSSTCESLREELRTAVAANDIEKMKNILQKLAAVKKERLAQKQEEVRAILAKNGQLDEQREARRTNFTITTRDGYTYEVQYTMSAEPAVTATIDSSKAKPGYTEVAMSVHVDSWSITNTTKGKKAPCLTGLAVAPLYSTAMGSLFDEVKKDSGDSYTYEATLSGKRYTTFNGRVDSSTVGLGTFATQSGDCTIEPDGAIRSTDKKMVTLPSGGITMRENLAKRFVELIKQPEGYVVRGTDSSGTYRNTTTVYGEIDGSSDTPIVHIAKGFKS